MKRERLERVFAQVTALEYWKSEHDQSTCQDALNRDSARGLFAIADGTTQSIFSNIWARVLVNHFLAVPLLSYDPFEIEWWLRQAQSIHQQRMPAPGSLKWHGQQKALSEGSYATLTTLRITAVEAAHAQAQLLAWGDSCVFVVHAQTQDVTMFPIEHPMDFFENPLCLPSMPALFDRRFHRCAVNNIELRHNDVVVLATDAVAKWLAGATRDTADAVYIDQQQMLMRIEELLRQTPESWAEFVQARRQARHMVDDDSTACILRVIQEQSPMPDERNGYELLGATVAHDEEVRQRRKAAFQEAQEAKNSVLLALAIGDTRDLQQEGIELPNAEIEHARAVANALTAAVQELRQALEAPNVVALLTPVWQQYAPLLQNESCAAQLRETLTRLGIAAVAPIAEPAGAQQEITAPIPDLAEAREEITALAQEIAQQHQRLAAFHQCLVQLQAAQAGEPLWQLQRQFAEEWQQCVQQYRQLMALEQQFVIATSQHTEGVTSYAY